MLVELMDVWKRIAWCSNIDITMVRQGDGEVPDFDLGLRRTLLNAGEKEHFIRLVYEFGQEGSVYFVKDYFEVEYCVIKVPGSERQYGDFIIMGPYRDTSLDGVHINELLEGKMVPGDYASELKEYYNAVPVVEYIDRWRQHCMLMAQLLYGSNNQLQSEYVSQNQLQSDFRNEVVKDTLSFRMIEERYALEGKVMKAISNGNTEDALKAMNQLGRYKIGERFKDHTRDLRNGIVIANTLWRKAAEMGNVHPAHIDNLSSQIAKMAEGVSSSQEAFRLLTEMIRKYCMLVRNYSLRGCSPVVQKVVNHINLSLTEDLSLKRLATEYSVNASYLSALFKKEMGVTLSEYVSQQRIRRAITLLNSTDLQIQNVAAESGIYDVNYFRKLFKRITGKTPTEYLRQVKSQPGKPLSGKKTGQAG